jgi:hypothetical protein
MDEVVRIALDKVDVLLQRRPEVRVEVPEDRWEEEQGWALGERLARISLAGTGTHLVESVPFMSNQTTPPA